ncbi:MAG: hypothetical protein AB8H80_02520 [Planctomycetota bacterium]
MTSEGDEHETAGMSEAAHGSVLRVVRGALPSPDPAGGDMPEPRLRREFKGLTIADLHREEIALMLPGKLRSALASIEAGDLPAADAALPAGYAAVDSGAGVVLRGPGYARRSRWSLLMFGFAAAALTGWTVSGWLLA